MRTRRDRAVDVAFFLFAVLFSVATADSVHLDESMTRAEHAADQIAGGLGCASVFLRRRCPVRLAVGLLLAGTYFHYMTGAALVALFTVAVRRERRVTAGVASVAAVQFLVFLVRGTDAPPEAVSSALTYFALVAGAVGWGLYVRSRRALIASLEERAVRAAEEARRQAREEIAREMHDVLAHRLSLLSVHAGALEFNAGASAADVRRASGVIRDSAHRALQDLREVIGVLRAPGPHGEGERPQPTLADVERLAAETRAAGTEVDYRLETGGREGTLPAVTGRTAYRVVQEGLTNARKHAPGGAVAVVVAGGPGEGLTVTVTSPLPETGSARDAKERRGDRELRDDREARDDREVRGRPASPGIPGAGQGLTGLAERAALAGGRLEHGPRDGAFVLRAGLPWDAGDEGDAESADGAAAPRGTRPGTRTGTDGHPAPGNTTRHTAGRTTG